MASRPESVRSSLSHDGSGAMPRWLPWWLVLSKDVLHWSPEEHWAWGAIWLMSCPFGAIIIAVLGYVLVKLGGDPRWGPSVAFVFALPAAIYLGRRTCEWLWPETIKKADENAAKRRG
jgi:hypothetical protein